MSETTANAPRQLSQDKDQMTSTRTAATIPFDPDSTEFPTRNNVPQIKGALPGAAWVWGENDNIGRLNLLTPKRVKAAAAEIKTGEMVSINLPLNVPEFTFFDREVFKHEIKTLVEGRVFDDLYHLNTQSGTQWDGFRHISHLGTGAFYNDTHAEDIVGPNATDKCSIHHWSNHGIAGRGVLLDYRSYAEKTGIHYDADEGHSITYDELYKCGKDQGMDIRPEAQGGDIKIGDLLFVRSGFVKNYYSRTLDEHKKIASRTSGSGLETSTQSAGLAQEEEILDWLHDSYFAAVAGDSPTFEAWPKKKEYYLHEYLLPRWGCPIGEMLDLEKLSEKCHRTNRWTFFVTSAPANVPGGVGSHVNGTAIF